MPPDLSLAAAVAALALHRPSAVSVVDDAGAALTAAELDAAAGALAAVLADGGLRAGARVAWAGRNDTGLLVTMLAAQRLAPAPEGPLLDDPTIDGLHVHHPHVARST